MRKKHHFHIFLKKRFNYYLKPIYSKKSVHASTKLKKVLDIFINEDNEYDFDDYSSKKWQSFFNKKNFSFWKEKIKVHKKSSFRKTIITDISIIFKQIFIGRKLVAKMAIIIFICAISAVIFTISSPQTSKKAIAKIDKIILKPFALISENKQIQYPQTTIKKNIKLTPAQLSEFIRKNQFKLNEVNISQNNFILSSQDILGIPVQAKNDK